MTEPARRLDIGVYGARGIPSTYSGYETFLTVLLPELAARGHRVTIYCRRDSIPGSGSYRGVQRIDVADVPITSLSTLSHSFAAAGRVRRAGHDVVLVVNVACAPSCLVLRASGQRVVLNTDGQEWLRGKWGPLARGVFRASGRLASTSASALVADCAAMSDVYRQHFGAASTVIPYCWTGIESANDLPELAALGVQPRGYFLAAGRLFPENNLVSVARAHASGHSELPLLVAGTAPAGSPERSALEALALREPRLRLLGHVEQRSSFAALLANAVGYVHGHSVGGINPSLLEAMGCGARIVALDTPFNREALAGTGSYFSDPSFDLAPLLTKVEDEPADESARWRAACQERVRAVFSLDAVTDAYEDLLQAVAGARAWASSQRATAWSPSSGA